MAPKPQKTRKFNFFFQNPAILGIASRKRVIFDRVTHVLPLFLTFSRKKSQLDAVPAQFFF